MAGFGISIGGVSGISPEAEARFAALEADVAALKALVRPLETVPHTLGILTAELAKLREDVSAVGRDFDRFAGAVTSQGLILERLTKALERAKGLGRG